MSVEQITTKIQCEIWLALNELGDWIVTDDESSALEKLGEDYGGNTARVVKLTVSIAPPEMTEVEVDVPDEAGRTTDVVVADEAVAS